MEDLLAAVDIGTTKFCALIGKQSNENIEITGVGKAEARGIENGSITNGDEATNALQKAIIQAEEMATAKINSVFVNVTGNHLQSQGVTGTVSIAHRDRIIRPADVDRVIDVAMEETGERNGKIVYVAPQQFSVDNQNGITNPVKMRGRRLDVQLEVVTGSATSIRNLTRCVSKMGLEIDQLVPEPIASANAVLTPLERDQGTTLLDIGGSTSGLAMFKNNRMQHSKTIPVGGNHITKDLTAGLNATFETAEKIKISYGIPPTSTGGKFTVEDEIEVPTVSGPSCKIQMSTIREIIGKRIEGLTDRVVAELKETGFHNMTGLGVVITGGSAQLKGLIDFLSHRYSFKVRKNGRPSDIHGLKDVIANPSYATAIGLLKCAAHSNTNQFSQRSSWKENREKDSTLFKWLSKLLP